MGTSLLFESIAREVLTYFNMRTFIVFLAIFGAALSTPSHRDLDRNIFDDAWNGIQDAGHAIQDAANSALNAAETTKEVTELIFRCKDVAMDVIGSIDVGKIRTELAPMAKDGMKDDDFKIIGNTIQGFSGKLDRFGECMSQTGEFKPQDSWWNPFGRAGIYKKKDAASDRGFQLPTAYSLSISAAASAALVGGLTGQVEVGGAINTKGQMIGFASGCAGAEISDELASVDGSLTLGFWNDLTAIPGKSLSTGASLSTPDIKIGVGVDLVWDFGGKGYIGATISLIGGVDITDGVIIPLPDFQINPVSGCYGVCMFGDCKAAGA